MVDNMYQKFLVIFGITTFSFLLSVALFNFIVDPYNIWNFYRRTGFNQWTPKSETMDRLILPIRFVKMKPETLFLGNSQVAWGVEASKYTELTGKSAYNMGMLGASIYEVRRILEYAASVDENLKEVYVSVFFEQFAANDRHPITQKSEILDANTSDKQYLSLGSFAKTALSVSALEDSVETVRENITGKYDFDFYTSTGRWSDEAIERFCSVNKWSFDWSIKLMARDNYHENMILSETAMEELCRIVKLCQEKSIKLHVYTLPIHARYMENYASTWEVYEEWMRRMVQIAPVTSFADYNQFTMSAAPENKSNQYYWDSLHVKVALSDMVIAELAGKESLSLGVEVNKDNVETHLSRLKNKRIAWEKEHPESMEEVRYYAGFSTAIPTALLYNTPITGKSVVRLNTDSGTDKLTATFQQQDRLDLSGNHLTPAGPIKTIYVVLAGGNGKEYYTLAEPVLDASMAAFMHDKSYEKNGFHIQEPLRKVEKGNYELYLIEVAEDGIAYKSGSLASITIK